MNDMHTALWPVHCSFTAQHSKKGVARRPLTHIQSQTRRQSRRHGLAQHVLGRAQQVAPALSLPMRVHVGHGRARRHGHGRAKALRPAPTGGPIGGAATCFPRGLTGRAQTECKKERET